jgi:dihydrofolate reductase
MARNRVIGLRGKLPWNLPADRQAFKALTKDRIIILGRKTFEEEPNQCHIQHTAKCIVVSKSLSTDVTTEQLKLARSFPEALDIARLLAEDISVRLTKASALDVSSILCWVVGGERIFHEALLHPSCVSLHLTQVDTEVDLTDENGVPYPVQDLALFPEKYRWENKFKEIARTEYAPIVKGSIGYTNFVYHRLKGRR